MYVYVQLFKCLNKVQDYLVHGCHCLDICPSSACHTGQHIDCICPASFPVQMSAWVCRPPLDLPGQFCFLLIISAAQIRCTTPHADGHGVSVAVGRSTAAVNRARGLTFISQRRTKANKLCELHVTAGESSAWATHQPQVPCTTQD